MPIMGSGSLIPAQSASTGGGRRFGGGVEINDLLGRLTGLNLSNAIDATSLQRLFMQEGMTQLNKLKTRVGKSSKGTFSRQGDILALLAQLSSGASGMQTQSLEVAKSAQETGQGLLRDASILSALKGFQSAF